MTPLTALKFAELTLKAGIPKGVVNIIPGSGKSGLGKGLGLRASTHTHDQSGGVGRAVPRMVGGHALGRHSAWKGLNFQYLPGCFLFCS